MAGLPSHSEFYRVAALRRTGFPGSHTGTGRRCEQGWPACYESGLPFASEAEDRRVPRPVLRSFEHVLESPQHRPPKAGSHLFRCRRKFRPSPGQPGVREAAAGDRMRAEESVRRGELQRRARGRRGEAIASLSFRRGSWARGRRVLGPGVRGGRRSGL
jgi:hypothetical protein